MHSSYIGEIYANLPFEKKKKKHHANLRTVISVMPNRLSFFDLVHPIPLSGCPVVAMKTDIGGWIYELVEIERYYYVGQ